MSQAGNDENAAIATILGGLRQPQRPFAVPQLVLDQLLIDPPRFVPPRAVLFTDSGVVFVFRGTHDAWQSERALTGGFVFRLAGVRIAPRLHTRRRGNVLFVSIGRQPRLDEAAARLP